MSQRDHRCYSLERIILDVSRWKGWKWQNLVISCFRGLWQHIIAMSRINFSITNYMYFLQCSVKVKIIQKLSHFIFLWHRKFFLHSTVIIMAYLKFLFQCAVNVIKMTESCNFMLIWLMIRFSCNVPYYLRFVLLHVILAKFFLHLTVIISSWLIASFSYNIP